MDEYKEQIVNRLFNKYGSLVLDRGKTSEAVDKSTSTLDRWRKKGINLEWRKVGESTNSPIEYTLEAIAEYIVNKPSNKVI